MERYIAIDNVCAWPNLTLMPDGAVAATIFNQPTHGGWEGDVECWASQDQGRSWKLRGVPAPHDPGTNRMNVAAGLGHDGNLVVLASGWSRRNPVGTFSKPSDGEILPMWACRSKDGGRSWSHQATVAPPPGKPDKIIPFGDIIQLPNQTLGACVYGWDPPHGDSAYFYASTDGGQSWAVRGAIREGNANETAPLALPDGRLLAASRTLDDAHLELFESADQGATWHNVGPVTLGNQHPGHLLLLKNGHLLLSFGIRNKGLCGVGVRLSEDQGRTWGPPRRIVAVDDTADHGYPATVENEDRTLLTAYYCSGIPEHCRYHMGVVRWQGKDLCAPPAT